MNTSERLFDLRQTQCMFAQLNKHVPFLRNNGLESFGKYNLVKFRMEQLWVWLLSVYDPEKLQRGSVLLYIIYMNTYSADIKVTERFCDK